ncbi:sigma-54 dependent transcriptional regulator [Geobacter sulfurreducens]|uniref:Sigma-54-dependent sensor transcriptional response regulator, PAS domain-containing n=1 Tax=Geobacter sulfurreducens (strain ATCC 51573 / DSM 12127 / PCA) TaxID=243231 RepID=Q74A84_GEOSL|nr:sigma-54 dependent transcriptional regulator [Geobacter sulfurreducens]AAR35879.1 sigma-54-dependent sensor transcriptional response regulator, PAS domain-containing [Geobacter sulfurreducens PCA]UAC03204.1 sigma 54-interacting transcriptional regulator [Geobacter sulfurreducens]HCD94851.1 sigma-54-dependent Fis family transcriptional regulator [Geobacter sulfurreducens]HML78653.1 sigma 54-interacting transcriptional regulator [Geobacter sulfurreducens]
MARRVLIVEDEDTLRFTFEHFLAAEGYAVDTAADFAEAIGKVESADYDLVFTDIILGNDNGIDVLREVKERQPSIPVVMITGYPNVETASDAVRLGAFDYLPKPVKRDALLRVARMALEHKDLMEEREKYRTNLEAIFQSVDDAILTVDLDMNVVAYNESGKYFFSLAAESIGRRYVPGEGNGAFLHALTETLKTKRPVETQRTECVVGGSEKRVVSLKTSPLVDRTGTFSGAVMVVRDETRLDDLEKSFEGRETFHNLVGSSPRMKEIYAFVESLADVPTTVLVTGESGTGKELVAAALHYKGGRSTKPFVKVNCSALAEPLLESELFGHVKGAFTGAIKDKMGRFQKADGGTIFLDEIGDISPGMQVRLLRVLQEREFERVGDSTPIKVDVRVIAATNVDLAEKVRIGQFREDLFYRLKVVRIHIPPLRERREDIPMLVEHFLAKFRGKFKKDVSAVSDEVMKVFMSYPWPGNVRELEHVLEHSCIVCTSGLITLEHLPSDFMEHHEIHGNEPATERETTLQAIRKALEKSGGNKAKAARLLGISRITLYRKLNELKIVHDE